MDKITKEKLVYNKALVIRGYLNMGKYTKAYDLICKIENEVKGESLEVRKTMVEIGKIYKKLGYTGKSYAIYGDLNEGRWGLCEENLLDKIKPEKEFEKVKKFAPPPEMYDFFENEDEEESKEKEKKIDEKVVLAKFYLERKKSRVNSFELLKEILNSEKENNFTTRKVMFQAAKLYGELGMSHIQKTIEIDLIEGKWGKCEKQILDKLNEEDKKDLWDKTKELFKNKKKIPLKKSSQILFSKC
jgi:hypothetical protein